VLGSRSNVLPRRRARLDGGAGGRSRAHARRRRRGAGPAPARGRRSRGCGLRPRSRPRLPRRTHPPPAREHVLMSLGERVERALAVGGSLSRRWPEWEERPGQRALAIEVAHTLERGGVLLAEAPTGVGKSLAYLLPAIWHAAESGERVVVATYTR